MVFFRLFVPLEKYVIAKESISNKIEIIQFVAIFEDIPFDLGRVDPSDEIFHISDILLSRLTRCQVFTSHLVTKKAGSVTTSVPTRI